MKYGVAEHGPLDLEAGYGTNQSGLACFLVQALLHADQQFTFGVRSFRMFGGERLADCRANSGAFATGSILIQVLLNPVSQGTAPSAVTTGQRTQITCLP